MNEFLKQSDIISVHVPLSSATEHLIDTNQFEQMKDGVIIVNTARGPVVIFS